MKKLISVLAVLFTMFTLNAYPKFTMLDYNCGDTPEYTAKFVELDTTKKVSQEHINYLLYLRAGTWIIEFDDGQKVYASLYKGEIIPCGYPKRLKCEVKESAPGQDRVLTKQEKDLTGNTKRLAMLVFGA